MKVIGVIPARWGSTRFPGKPLALISGKPMIHWVIEGSKKSRLISELLIATDDERISQSVANLGVRSVMTDSELPTGTDRVRSAIRNVECDVVINIQGDEPLIDGTILDELVAPFQSDRELEMATLASELRPGDLESDTTAKIVLNKKSEAIYFSRFPIPYSRNRDVAGGCLKHIGIYAFRPSFLEAFCRQAPVAAELAEGLEQLRALYLGARIRVVKVEHESWGVDRPEDIGRIEKIMLSRRNQ